VTGVFAEWQPRYAEHRVATFPVENKIPRIRHWTKVGLKGSAQLAMKFADADAFGFQCGKANRITLIDIDSRDEGVVREAIKLFGQSPILWRTGSGNHAMPFRYNGEARRVRALPGLPIDALGGGFAVAPPSMGSTGRYEFLQGGLADLDRLPVARSINIEQAKPRKETPGRINKGTR
jgi:Bifunctional DNA primase/polymerase, N-terminal